MPNRNAAAGVTAWLIVSAMTVLLARSSSGTATVTVISDPSDAAVYVDGQFAGRTPLTVAPVEPGDHRLRVVKNGYLENGRVITVAAGKTASVQLRLTAASGDVDGARDQAGGGISSGPPSSSKRKWWYLAAGGGAAATALALATRNGSPVAGTLSAMPPVGVLAATPIAFSAPGAHDPDDDVLTYSWDFGDGATAKEQAPRHVYNNAGSFAVKCTVSDGNHSDTATTSVTVRSLTATWSGVLQGVPETVVLTQSGAALTGRFSDATYGSGSLSGFVSTSPPLVRFTVIQPGINPFTFTADPNADVSTLSGVVNGSGFTDERFTITRQ